LKFTRQIAVCTLFYSW